MEAIFLKVLNMSIAAGWMILAAVLIRMILKKAPKVFRCILWALVAVRLICPFSLESVLSLIPSGETISQEVLYSPAPTINSGISVINQTVNPVISQSLAPAPGTSVNPLQIWIYLASAIWVFGMILMFLYAVFSYGRLYKKVRTAIRLQGNVWICDEIDSPFILGVVNPKIYLPSILKESHRVSVLAHENAHIKRHDHWWKPLGFLLLSVYWFHPLVWIAYILLCKDIEMACDEHVVKDMDAQEKKDYSKVLLSCSMSHKMITVCPLAFGEIGVKARIRSVLHYKKPGFWILLTAIVASVVLGICFLTNPKEEPFDIEAASTMIEKYAGPMVPYVQNPDGTWSADGETYQYRVVLRGTMPNAAAESVFTVLTNDMEITFEQVWQSMFSSQSDSGLDIKETRIVDLGTNKKISVQTDTFRSLEEVKQLLASYPDDMYKFTSINCSVIFQGAPPNGMEQSWELFYDAVINGEPAEMVIVQSTVEGDPVLDYVQYNGESFYHVHDSSRDAFAGGELFREQEAPYLKVFETTEENGDICRYVFLTDQKDLTLEDTYEYYMQSAPQEDMLLDHILYTVLDNTYAEVPEGVAYHQVASVYEEDEVLIDEITKLEVVNGNTGESIMLDAQSDFFWEIVDCYHNLDFNPVEESEEYQWRSGYKYYLNIYDQNGEMIQNVIPYTDRIQIDGKIYDSSINGSSVELILHLGKIF